MVYCILEAGAELANKRTKSVRGDKTSSSRVSESAVIYGLMLLSTLCCLRGNVLVNCIRKEGSSEIMISVFISLVVGVLLNSKKQCVVTLFMWILSCSHAKSGSLETEMLCVLEAAHEPV